MSGSQGRKPGQGDRRRASGGGRRGASGRGGGGGRRGRPRAGSDKRTEQSTRRGGEGGADKPRRRDLQGAAANLPNWVVEALERVTPAKRVGAALTALGEASDAFAAGSYQRAMRQAQKAKDLAPRDATIREILGLAAYRLGDWRIALAELRAFRRMVGETTHLPVEMDVLRAMGRPDDVEAAWRTLQERRGRPAVMKEGAVVYASHLIDQGDLEAAWAVVAPDRMAREPFPEDLRLWYVAARVAALRGDLPTATKLRNAILEHDPSFPGIDELETLIARA